MKRIYERGTIKVVWIDNTKYIYSKMFFTEEDAERFAQAKKEYLIFKLVKQEKMEDFTWELLPYGKFKIYKLLFNLYKKGLLLKLITKI